MLSGMNRCFTLILTCSAVVACSQSLPSEPDAGAQGPSDAGQSRPDLGFVEANHPPSANAGADLNAQIGDSVVLDASGSSDQDGTPLTFRWRLLSGPRPELSFDATGAHPTFVPTWNGRFEIDLAVSDGQEESHDTVVIMVSCRAPEIIRGYQDETATWAERNPPPSCDDYVVAADTLAPAAKALTLAPGVRVRVDPGARLGAEGGSFIAVGTEEAPIWIGGSAAGRGTWPGIQLHDAPNAQLIHATVEGGGEASGGAVRASGATALLIEHSTVSGSLGYGVVVELYSLIENFYGDVFTDNALGAAEVEINQVNKLTADSRFTGNLIEQIRVRGSSLNTPSTWSSLGVPFVIGEQDEAVSVGRDLRIEAGAVVEVWAGSGLEIALPAITFESFGDGGQPVRIRGQQSGMGQWRGLAIKNGAHADLRGTIIEGGGGGAPWSSSQDMSSRANVTVLAGDPPTVVRLSATTLSSSPNQGLWIEQSSGVDVSCADLSADQPIVPACPYAR